MKASLNATQRAVRLLGFIPWVAEQESVLLDDIVSRFDYPRHQLIADLMVLSSEDAFVDDDFSDTFTNAVSIDWLPESNRVSISCPKWLSDPMRLNGDEAARLMAVGQASLSVDGEPGSQSLLLRSLTKLQLMLNDKKRGLNTRSEYFEHARNLDKRSASESAEEDFDFTIKISLKGAAKTILEGLRQAITECKRIEIEYYSYARDHFSVRAVDPLKVFYSRGAWYCGGWCHIANNERLFRVDRIRSLKVTDVAVTTGHSEWPTQVLDPARIFDTERHQKSVTLRLDREVWWAVEQLPLQKRRELDDGRLEVDLVVSELPWLARLLLQLGPHVGLITEDPCMADICSTTAESILKLYR